MARPIEQKYKGKRNGRLVALEYVVGKKWLFQCDCGKVKIMPASNVFRKPGRRTVQSCGCLSKEMMRNGGMNPKHRMTGTKFYKAWGSMFSRCYRKGDARYEHYAKKGIKVLWKSFEEFKKDMYPSFLRHQKLHGGRQTTLDRRDVYGHYCKDNCRWATQRTQQRNRTI